MSFEDIIIIACLVLAVICYVGYRYFSWNVRLCYNKKYRLGVAHQSGVQEDTHQPQG